MEKIAKPPVVTDKFAKQPPSVITKQLANQYRAAISAAFFHAFGKTKEIRKGAYGPDFVRSVQKGEFNREFSRLARTNHEYSDISDSGLSPSFTTNLFWNAGFPPIASLVNEHYRLVPTQTLESIGLRMDVSDEYESGLAIGKDALASVRFGIVKEALASFSLIHLKGWPLSGIRHLWKEQKQIVSPAAVEKKIVELLKEIASHLQPRESATG